jgi:hypothetical protein
LSNSVQNSGVSACSSKALSGRGARGGCAGFGASVADGVAVCCAISAQAKTDGAAILIAKGKRKIRIIVLYLQKCIDN